MYNPPLQEYATSRRVNSSGLGLILLDHSQSHNYLLITDPLNTCFEVPSARSVHFRHSVVH